MKINSTVTRCSSVPFPAFTGESVYMREFTKRTGLPPDLHRWQPTIDAMLANIDTDESIFVTIDQKHLIPGQTHRRPGPHVDYYWRGNEHVAPPAHEPTPAPPPAHGIRGSAQAIILAFDNPGCVAYLGQVDGTPDQTGSMGDCSHLDLTQLRAIELDPGFAWVGDTAQLIHESAPVIHECRRTLVRLNVNGWTPTTEEST